MKVIEVMNKKRILSALIGLIALVWLIRYLILNYNKLLEGVLDALKEFF